MRKKLFAATAVAMGVVLALAFATPASAHVVDAYHGSRGHGWTNTAHTRIGVQDTNCDNIDVATQAVTENNLTFRVWDPDGCFGDTGAAESPRGQKIVLIRVCIDRIIDPCGEWQAVSDN